MTDREYVVFTLRDARYAIEAATVQEIVALPALTPIAEAPEYIAGILDVRGAVVPVIDLAIRMGFAAEPYHLTDSIILFHHAAHRFGIIINDVHEVRHIDAGSIEPVPVYGPGSGETPRFIKAIAKGERGMVALLWLDSLIAVAEAIEPQARSEPGAIVPVATRHLPDLTPDQLSLLRNRAGALMQPPDSVEVSVRALIALFRLGDEYFGAKLDVIREFTEMREPTLVPCAPDHIVGQMNLRGDILTLVDIRPALRMSLARSTGKAMVIVLDIPELHAGIVADEVIDVVAIAPDDITPVPAAIQSPVDEYILGVARHGDHVVAILDLAMIFERGELDASEEF